MKIDFQYCGLRCNLNLEEANEVEVNPIPIMEALIKMVNSISYYKDFELTITSKD